MRPTKLKAFIKKQVREDGNDIRNLNLNDIWYWWVPLAISSAIVDYVGKFAKFTEADVRFIKTHNLDGFVRNAKQIVKRSINWHPAYGIRETPNENGKARRLNLKTFILIQYRHDRKYICEERQKGCHGGCLWTNTAMLYAIADYLCIYGNFTKSDRAHINDNHLWGYIDEAKQIVKRRKDDERKFHRQSLLV